MVKEKNSLEEEKSSCELHKTFFTDFIDWWLEKESLEVPNFEKKKYTESSIKKLHNINRLIKEFQGEKKILMAEISHDILYDFSVFIILKGYTPHTKKQLVSLFRFFCKKAVEHGIFVCHSFTFKIIN